MQNMDALIIFESKENLLKASPKEIEFFEQFPREEYEVHNVPLLGSFFLDRKKDFIKDVLRKGLVWEPKVKELIKKYVIPGSNVVDIGAHIGAHTLTFSECAGHVYAFEPQKKLYAELMMNLKLNQCLNVTAYRAALGSERATIQMDKVAFENEGATRIGIGGEIVPMISLDELLLDDVSFMKIDVENSEKQVLEGARETILRNLPVILIEILGHNPITFENRGVQVAQIVELLVELGFIITPFTKYDYLAIPMDIACKEFGWVSE